jgi:hypothetical protein
MNKMDGKIKSLSNFFNLSNFFKLDVLLKNNVSQGGDKMGASTMFPWDKRTKLLGDQVSKCLTRNFERQMLSKSNIFYSIGNILKVR